jgi:long-chain acyl-CoA synthetase
MNLVKYKYNLSNFKIITEYGRNINYSEVLDFSELLFSKINHRCLVFCLCQNKFEALCGYFSFITNKVVPLMLDSSIDIDLLNNLIDTYKPEYLWLPKNSEVYFKQKNSCVYEGEEYKLINLVFDNYYLLNDKLALLLTTSGSTGSPKLVRISYENILANAESISNYLSIDENERPITSLPLHYSFGLSILNSHLIKGATILLTSKSLFEKEFWEFLKSEKATSMSGVPYTYEILKKLRFFRMDLPNLKTLTQAGGKLNDELNKEISEFCLKTNKRFFVMYGQTEATARMSYLPHEYSIKKVGSMGIAIPGGEFHLIDEAQIVIEGYDKIGELVYKGKNVSLGYAEKGDDLEKGDENFGILYTGDIAKRDIDNFYYIVGRKKRFIKLFGNRVNLDETERLIKNIIQDCVCAGTDDKMVIYITEQDKENLVRNYISQKLGINHNAFKVKYIEKIPKNSAGKTEYSKLIL